MSRGNSVSTVFPTGPSGSTHISFSNSVRGFEPGSADAKKITKYLNNYSRAYTYGVASYTPYMYSKAEFAKLWDNGKMDMAIDGMLDGVSSFSMNKIKQGFQEVKSAFWHRPFSDPEGRPIYLHGWRAA